MKHYRITGTMKLGDGKRVDMTFTEKAGSPSEAIDKVLSAAKVVGVEMENVNADLVTIFWLHDGPITKKG